MDVPPGLLGSDRDLSMVAGTLMWFDGAAEQFDETAGLEPDVGRRIAEAILERCGATPDEVILDLGAGTGAVGRHFTTLPNRYLGLDVSSFMLEVFRRKLGTRPTHMLLMQADSDRPWPILDHALAVVFASRVVHHLHTRHVVAETLRVCRPGGYLLLGQVTRDGDSMPSRLQRHKHALLTEHSFRPRAGR
jgi:ubiquinone/menaquinone biosynthesis C-methylase UbiE